MSIFRCVVIAILAFTLGVIVAEPWLGFLGDSNPTVMVLSTSIIVIILAIVIATT